jgi:hypothetical protein
MKINKKALELIEKGLSAKTVSKLTESQINVLHSKLMVEAQITTTQTVDLTADDVKGGYKIPDTVMSGKKNVVITPNPKSQGGIRVEPTAEGELDEEEEVTIDPNKETETQDPKQVGPSSDDGFGDETDGMGMFESEKDLKSGEPNPWAICHAQVGPKKTRKFERCVKSVKKQLEEGKNPVSLFIESQILKIVEKKPTSKNYQRGLVKISCRSLTFDSSCETNNKT